jgi:hypothetical protein
MTAPTLPKPRYTTEAQIVALIESSVKKAASLEHRSWELERQAVALIEEIAKSDDLVGEFNGILGSKVNRPTSGIVYLDEVYVGLADCEVWS